MGPGPINSVHLLGRYQADEQNFRHRVSLERMNTNEIVPTCFRNSVEVQFGAWPVAHSCLPLLLDLDEYLGELCRQVAKVVANWPFEEKKKCRGKQFFCHT